MRARGNGWLLRVREAFAAHGDPARAADMQAYMKSSMPYHGVPKPTVTRELKPIFDDYPFESPERWDADVRAIFDGARFREEWYAALALLSHPRARAFATKERWRELLALHEHLVVGASWWDIVDEVAAHHVGALLAAFPGEMKPAMREWSRSDQMWKARTSILSQLRFHSPDFRRFKPSMDEALLFACIEPSIASKEFFLRKAIGWALREYSKRNPDAVRRYVRANDARLSGLSKREALRLISAEASA
ncbi:MAG: DNA alkylation repair protein [Polyangiaceae bacterium]